MALLRPQRLPIRWLILGAMLASLAFSTLVWSVGVYFLGQNFLWYSQVFRMLHQVRMVWTGDDTGWVGFRKGLPALDTYPRDAAERVQLLDTPGTSARILDLSGRVLAQSPAGQEVPPPGLGEIRMLAGQTAEDAQRHQAYVFRGEREWMVVLIPIRQHQRDVGVLQFASQRRQPREVTRTMLGYVLAVAGLATVVTSLAALIVARWLAIPMERLQRATEAFMRGNWNARTGLGTVDSRNEVYRVSAAFDQMAEQIQGNLETQRRFIADASHELKTPLTAIMGMSQMLPLTHEPEKLARAARIIERESERMSSLVQDLLTLSKADQAPEGLEVTRVDLGQLTRQVVETLQALYPGREVQLQLDEPLWVLGSSEELSRLLRNLIENALQHTDSAVRVESRPPASDRVVLEVSDRGPGIEAADLPKIFDRFYRPDASRARSSGGSGLGLAIVRSIAQRHRGQVQVESRPGEGTCFRVLLPLSRD
jgi:two-component system OmpR family sensor kinase